MSTPAQIGHPHERDYIVRAREVFIRLSLIALLGITCFLILRPFLAIIAWGIIIAIAAQPAYRKVCTLLGGRQRLAAVICTIVLLAIIILPAVLMAGTLSEGIQSLNVQLKTGSLKIPPPPSNIENWPIIGGPLTNLWSMASTNVAELLNRVGPQLREKLPSLLSASAGLAMTFLQFILSILLAGFLLANSHGNERFARLVFDRVFGRRGLEFEELTSNTIRSVTNGILGVAIIQSIFAGLGFVVVGLPGAGVWAMIFLVAAVLQIGMVILIPAVIIAFTITSTSHAVIFLIWCVFVGLLDNVLKPLLLGRGSKVPTIVIFLGVLGGFVLMGIVGLFLGAIILSVAHELFLAWLHENQIAETAQFDG